MIAHPLLARNGLALGSSAVPWLVALCLLGMLAFTVISVVGRAQFYASSDAQPGYSDERSFDPPPANEYWGLVR